MKGSLGILFLVAFISFSIGVLVYYDMRSPAEITTPSCPNYVPTDYCTPVNQEFVRYLITKPHPLPDKVTAWARVTWLVSSIQICPNLDTKCNIVPESVLSLEDLTTYYNWKSKQVEAEE